MRQFDVMAVTPPCLADATLAIGVTRAGGVGILNLAKCEPTQSELSLQRLIALASGPCGVRFETKSVDVVSQIKLPAEITTVVLGQQAGTSSKILSYFQQQNRPILIEVNSPAQAKTISKKAKRHSAIQGLILLGWGHTESADTLLSDVLASTALPVYVTGNISEVSVTQAYEQGAVGVVLTSQLSLLRESQLPKAVKQAIAVGVTIEPIDGNSLDQRFANVGPSGIRETIESTRKRGWQQAIQQKIGWASNSLWPLDEGVAQAAGYAERYRSVNQAVLGLKNAVETYAGLEKVSAETNPSNIAIIGLECVLPKAANRNDYWQNIVDAVYAIGEIPADRWDVDLYFDEDPKAKDKIYSKWGGFIDDVVFDPLQFGMPPNSLKSIDPMQLLALKVAKDALDDAGYGDSGFDHQQTGVILGCSGGLGDVGSYYLLRSMLPDIVGDAAADLLAQTDLPEWTEDSFAGLLPNVSAGRIANRLDFGGTNFVVDAACGSSLAAVHLAVKELESENVDMMVVGGVDTVQSPFGYLCFSKTTALSPTGTPRTFDENGNGIAISEGVVMFVMKRLADAERDGDRIYAVIQGTAGSSDGKALGLTAPRPEGQVLAFERAYNKAGFEATSVGLFEAHGTGTAVGDRTEAISLGGYLADQGGQANAYPIGSVKSMIGHTKASAGVAGLAKITMALHNKVLPPTLGVEKPHPKSNFGSGPLYVNSETRPWIHSADHPRRASVSAFGFGGTNFHVVAEEYTRNFLGDGAAPVQRRSSELVLISAESHTQLNDKLLSLKNAIQQAPHARLIDLAYSCWQTFNSAESVRAAIVAASPSDLVQKLGMALDREEKALKPSSNIFISDTRNEGKIAFLFPGQGAQYPNMLRDLAINFSEVREAYELADRLLPDRFERQLSSIIFPPPAFNRSDRKKQQLEITETNVAQPALGAAGIGLYNLLRKMGLQADMAAGHSYGEYVALCIANVFNAKDMIRVSEARGACMVDLVEDGLGTMAAIMDDHSKVQPIIDTLDNVWIANYNAPDQTIISGTDEGVAIAVKALAESGLQVRQIEVAAAFHSPIVAKAKDAFAATLADVEFNQLEIPVYSNTTAKPHTFDDLKFLMGEHMAAPVRFIELIEAMYADGARVFLEVGPRNILTNLTSKILAGREHHAINCDRPKRNGVTTLHAALAQLAALGISFDIEHLFEGRSPQSLDLTNLAAETAPQPLRATAWLVNGGYARPHKVPRRTLKAVGLPAAAPTPAQPATPTPTAVTKTAAPSEQPAIPPKNGNGHLRKNGVRQLKKTVATGQPANASASTVTALVDSYKHLMNVFLENQRELFSSVLGGETQTFEAVTQQIVRSVTPKKQPNGSTPKTKADGAVPRSVFTFIDAAAPASAPRQFDPNTVVALTDDGHGIAQLVAKKISAAGGQARIIARGEQPENVGGIIHLQPMATTTPISELDLDGWQTQTQSTVKDFFGLVQHSAESLKSATNSFVVTITNTAAQPQHGALSGFIKTVAKEWPTVATQHIDLFAQGSIQAIADLIWAELNAPQLAPNVRYHGRQRQTVSQVGEVLNESAETNLKFSADDVILVTGGARGITADVVAHLAQQAPATFILVGRSPIPQAPEAAATAQINDAKALKSALIAAKKAAGDKIVLKEIERDFWQIMKAREMRANLAAIEATGAKVSYFAADVRDMNAMRLVVEQASAKHGPITGVIHGAGLIEDKKIEQKSAESFTRVFDTKADSMFILSRLLDPKKMKFVAIFSSAAGAIGNMGQIDYASANALLNSLAAYLDNRWKARVVAFCWGPWGGGGMVSAELEQQFAAQGVQLITTQAGCRAVETELKFGGKGQSTVIYAGGSWGAGEAATRGVMDKQKL